MDTADGGKGEAPLTWKPIDHGRKEGAALTALSSPISSKGEWPRDDAVRCHRLKGSFCWAEVFKCRRPGEQPPSIRRPTPSAYIEITQTRVLSVFLTVSAKTI